MTMLPPIDPVGSLLSFQRQEKKEEEITLHKSIANVAVEVLLNGNNAEGNEVVLETKSKEDTLSDFLEPKSRHEALMILGFDPESNEGRHVICDLGREKFLATLEKYSLATKEGRWARFVLAKMAAAKGSVLSSADIQHYGFDPKTEVGRMCLFEIAKIAAANDGWGTSEFIQKYRFDAKTEDGQMMLFEIAMIAAAHNGGGTSRYIKNYGFKAKTENGQKRLFEIARIAAAQDGSRTSKHIQQYRFDAGKEVGQQMLFKIAEVAAKQDGGGTSEYIQNYGFEAKTEIGQKRLFTIAKIAAAQDGFGTSVNIQNYGFHQMPEGQLWLFEIAKIAAAQNGWKTSEYIQNYGFEAKTEIGQKRLFTIAKIAAEQDGFGTSMNIQNYGFHQMPEGQLWLFEIAKIAAAENGWKTSEYHQRYGFDAKTESGQKMLFEIALIAGEHMKWKRTRFFRFYDFLQMPDGQKMLVEMARIAAAKNGWGTSESIKDYGFHQMPDGEKILFEIAKIAAANSGWGTSVNIENYGFNAKTEDGQMKLFLIAKIAAKQSPDGTSMNITNYGLDVKTEVGQKRLLEVAKIAAAKDGMHTSLYVNNYGFDPMTENGQKALLEVLHISARGNLYLAPQWVKIYKIKGRGALKNALQWIILRKIENHETDFLLKEWLDELMMGFPEVLKFNDYLEHLPTNPFELSKHILEFLKVDEKTKKWFENCRNREKDAFNHQRLLDWITFVVLFQFVSPEINLFQGKSFWLLEEIEKRDPRLRGHLTGQLLLTIIEGRLESLELGEETKERPLRLVRLIFCNYPKEAEGSCKRAIESFRGTKKRVALKEGGRQALIVESLLLINQTSLEPQTKGALVERLAAWPLEETLQAASLIKDIILFGGEEDLSGEPTGNTLKSTLEKHFSALCQLDVEGFSDKYQKTLGAWRNKGAIATYVAGLKSLNANEVIRLFREFLTSVLENTFEDKRTAPEGNPHLKAIKEQHPELFAKWNVSIQLDSSEIEVDEEKINVKDKIFAQLKMAVDNRHLGEAQEVKYPHFIACINKEMSPGRALQDVEDKLHTEISNEDKSYLTIEKALLQLISGENPEEIKKALEALKSRDLKNQVFEGDLKACENLLKEEFLRTGLKVVDSTDPNHFLLMGTEVQGSCQRVGGEPKQNRGLLGYMLDGKHRLFLVLDETGKIVARSVARLLVDEKDKPVLFLERLYVADNNSKYAPLIKKLAKKKASEMKVPLLVSKDEGGIACSRPYPFKIKALAGNVPFEYVDALRGIQSAPYEIEGALEVS